MGPSWSRGLREKAVVPQRKIRVLLSGEWSMAESTEQPGSALSLRVSGGPAGGGGG